MRYPVGRLSSSLLLVLCSPAFLAAQGLAIDHKPVQCIVAGKFPKMNACFSPASGLSRSRVFFRAEGTPKWFYVDMASDAPCHTGILPKPKKNLVQKKIEYYVQATDKAFEEGQTETYLPIVVANEAECQDLPIAPFVTKASVVVFPSVPAGFAGASALSATTVAAGVVGAGAAAAGAVAVANSSSDDSPTTTSPPATAPPTTAVPVTTVPPTTVPSTTMPPGSVNRPPVGSFRISPNPPSGKAPLTVNFNMCQSTDPDNDPLEFTFNFGDGRTDRGFCRMDHTYTGSSVRAAADRTYNPRICVTDGVEGHEQCKDYTVELTVPPADPCADDNDPPAVAISGPPSVHPEFQPFNVNLTASASDDSGISKVTYRATSFDSGPAVVVGESSTAPYTVVIDPQKAFDLFGCDQFSYGDFVAVAEDKCGNTATSAPVAYSIDGCGQFEFERPGQTAAGRLSWTSELDAPGAQGQLVLNGAAAFFPRSGRSMGAGEARSGENRIEALLVATEGRGGTWRIQFAPGAVAPGSLRVLAGEVALVTDDAVVFRLRGQAGERLVFTFRAPE